MEYYSKHFYDISGFDIALASSPFGSGYISVPEVTIFWFSQWGSRGCPIWACALPMVGVAPLATLCTTGRAAARDSMGEATSATGPGRRSSVSFTGADCIYGSGD